MRLQLVLGCCLMVWCGFSIGIALAIQPANPELSPEARRVLDYLESVYGKQVLAGYNVYVHTPDDYRQTGKMAAIWGRDIRWLGDPAQLAEHARKHGYILTLHWHWFFGEDSAWKSKRKQQVDLARVLTPGTAENRTLMEELDRAADVLQVFRDAKVPVLWRPLHEIDGGWFWWTDRDRPENTAQLWRVMFDYFTHKRKLNNLIWVYSAGVGDRKRKPVEYRKRFYPGGQFVDIAGIDIYGVDPKTDEEGYNDYFDVMTQVAPGKMLALSECDAIPNPDKMQAGRTPRWLYAMPWWGCPSPRRPVDWALYTMRHNFIVTLDEIPALYDSDTLPVVGILEPRDDGSAWFESGRLQVSAYAVDLGGRIDRVEFYLDDVLIGTVNKAPFLLHWQAQKPGCHELYAMAFDSAGNSSQSNRVHVALRVKDVARGKPVIASGGTNPEFAVDGNYYTVWSAPKADEAWIVVDLEKVYTIDRINLVWGWKIHPSDFAIDVALRSSDATADWTTVYTAKNLPYVTWKATNRVHFSPVQARFVRLRAMKRAGNQTWAGYHLAAFEVPVPVGQ